MFGVLRMGDRVVRKCKHRSSGPIYTASRTTFVNGRGLARLLDKSFPGSIITGSRVQFCDGRPIARIKDRIICGIAVTCSKDTFVGG